MSAIDTLRTALFGNPPDPNHEPSREGVLAAFTELNNSLSSLGVGLLPYETYALLIADTTQVEGALAYVYYNNGVTDDPANTVYQWRDSAWEVADWFFAIVEQLTENVIDEKLRNILEFDNVVDGVPALGGPMSSPSVRYDSTVDSNGYLQITSTDANTYMFIFRSNLGRVVGRTYRIIAEFSATNYTSGSTSFAIGFDQARQVGVNATASAENVYFVIRNGLVLVEQYAASGAISTPAGYTVTPNTSVTYLQTDIMSADLTENTDGTGTLVVYKNNTAVSAHSINKLPSGVFLGGLRLTANGVGKIRLMQAPDSLVTSETTAEVNIGPGNAVVPTQPVGMARAMPMGASVDVTGLTAARRVVPPGFPSYIPMLPVIVRSVGDVTVNNTAVGAFLARYPEVGTGSVAFVSTTGNNGTGVLNNENAPYATLNYALQSTTAHIIIVENGEHAAFRYDYTHSSQRPKLILARNRGLAKLVNPGDALSAATFTDTGDGVWKTTLADSDISDVKRVIVRDEFDGFSFPIRLLQFPYVAGETALRAAGVGFSYNTTTKELFIALSGVSVESRKSQLRAFYALTSQGGNARCLIYGSKIAMDGVDVCGLSIEGLNYNDGGTQRVPDVFLSNLTSYAATVYATNLGAGGLLVAENLRIHASQYDGFNANWGTAGDQALMNIVGCYGSMAGDIDTYGTSIDKNRQMMSSHAGYLVSIANIAEHNWGEEFSDTSVNNAPSLTWQIASMAAGRHPDLTVMQAFAIHGGNYGASFDRKAWFDTCVAVDGYDPNTVVIDNGATAKSFNCNFAGTVSGTLTPYTTDAP